MNRITTLALATFCAACGLVLSGCSATPTGPTAAPTGSATPAGGSTASTNTQTSETITGSRLPRKSTDRLLKQIGAAGAQEMERERPPSPGPRSN